MSMGIYSVLNQVADIGRREKQSRTEKRAFVPMPGGQPPMDPSMGGMPMDPSMGGMPMDPSMGGGGMPMDPGMAMVAGGEQPADIMAAQGMPVDPTMAAAGGAAMDPMAGPPAAGGIPPEIQSAIDAAVQAAVGQGGGGKGAGGGKAKLEDRLASIESMLSKVVGYIAGKGAISTEDVIPASDPSGSTGITPEIAPDTLGGPASVSAQPSEQEMKQASDSLARSLSGIVSVLSRKRGK